MNTRFSKSILVLAVVSLLAAGSIFAGNGNSDGSGNGKGGQKAGQDTEWNGGPAHKMARISEMLGLSELQEDQILDFFRMQEENRELMRARIMEAFGDEICAQRAANEGSFEELLLGMLDENQLLIHEEMKANRESRQANNRRGGRGNGGFECTDETDG